MMKSRFEKVIKKFFVSESSEEEHTKETAVCEKSLYEFPPIFLLKKGVKYEISKEEIVSTATRIEKLLNNFRIHSRITNVFCGPVVTTYEIQLEPGERIKSIVSLTDDMKLNLAVPDIRVEAPIPGKAAIGIEIPNKEFHPVMLRDVIESEEFQRSTSKIAFAVGKDIFGKTIVSDIVKMPHILISGTTGSGKSVCINALIMSILYKASPDKVKMIMIDPKVVELSVYNGIPHLLIPVVTVQEKALGVLNWAVAEMASRYQMFARYNVRNIEEYNAKLSALREDNLGKNVKEMYQLVIIIDNLYDLTKGKSFDIDNLIVQLTEKAHTTGIHLVLATQRPSVNVVSGRIKANLPCRIAFATTSSLESRMIIGMNGAEKLNRKGDMLFSPPYYSKAILLHGAYMSSEEIKNIVNYIIINSGKCEARDINFTQNYERDAYFVDAGKFIIEKEKASIGMLQRMFKIGFNRAARIMDQLVEAGVVGGEEGTKPRKILMTMEEFETYLAGEGES